MKALVFVLVTACLIPSLVSADDVADAITSINQIGPEGRGNPEAAVAWKTLTTSADGSAVIPLLESMETASPLARNWLRSAVEVIVEKEQKAGRELPLTELGTFLLDTRQSPQARRQAFDLISQLQPAVAEKMVPGFLNDPSNGLRRDAVQQLMDMAEAEKPAAAALLYQQALAAARDVDQVEKIAETLEDSGHPVDLPEHFGFLLYWDLVAPFDNSGREGFNTVYPPEESLDLSATYEGKDGKEIKWVDYSTTDKFGMVDFNPVFEPLKQVVGYAATTFNSPIEGPAEIRLGCKNAWKIWLNDEFIFGRDEYHRGMRIDQYTLPIQLKKGPNQILVKVCQNEQERDWTVQWQFQLRICDSTGTAILGTDRKPSPAAVKLDRRGRPITDSEE